MKFDFIKLKRRKVKKASKLLRVVFPALGLASAIRLAMRYRDEKKTRVLVAKPSSRSKKLLGIAVITTLTFFGRKYIYLRALSVDKKKQNRKIGSALIKRTEGIARNKGYNGIFLVSAWHRKDAHRFYQKKGFRRFLGIFFWKRFRKN